MRVLIACEFSGVVRRAFAARGHTAISADLLPAEDGETRMHFQGDARQIDPKQFDLIIAHPPCKDLAVSGARWLKSKGENRINAALAFFRWWLDADCKRIAVENPVSIVASRIRKPTQIVQPWWFGHGETKATCWWIKGLPLLKPTNIVNGRTPRVHFASPGPDRWKERSRTLQGMADAMADQWGNAL